VARETLLSIVVFGHLICAFSEDRRPGRFAPAFRLAAVPREFRPR